MITVADAAPTKEWTARDGPDTGGTAAMAVVVVGVVVSWPV